jgi:hypothetical protein
VLDSLNVFRHGREALNLRLLHRWFPAQKLARDYDIIHCRFGPNGQQALAMRDVGALQGPIITSFHSYKPGGTLLLNVPFLYWLHEEPYDYYRYTKYALQRFAEVSGFGIILIKELGGTPEILVDILSKSVLRLGLMGEWTAIALQAACRRLVALPLGSRISERTAKHFRLAYFIVARRN